VTRATRVRGITSSARALAAISVEPDWGLLGAELIDRAGVRARWCVAPRRSRARVTRVAGCLSRFHRLIMFRYIGLCSSNFTPPSRGCTRSSPVPSHKGRGRRRVYGRPRGAAFDTAPPRGPRGAEPRQRPGASPVPIAVAAGEVVEVGPLAGCDRVGVVVTCRVVTFAAGAQSWCPARQCPPAAGARLCRRGPHGSLGLDG